MLSPSIFSRPLYPGLRVDRFAKVNLILAEGEGAHAILDLAQSPEATPAFFARATLLFCANGASMGSAVADLDALAPGALWTLPTIDTTMFRLRGVLQTATMGTRIYAAGTEPFIGRVIAEAATFGVDPRSVITEHRGSLRRRVQCVHCKGMMEEVTHSPVTCAHCGLSLFVRDHYSRRLGAFQGVCIDAEAPGDIPAAEELYP
ncbi:MAG: dimethylamine monooxygenase subunit DmmA family protein [Pseudomonadota bacterium]